MGYVEADLTETNQLTTSDNGETYSVSLTYTTTESTTFECKIYTTDGTWYGVGDYGTDNATVELTPGTYTITATLSELSNTYPTVTVTAALVED